MNPASDSTCFTANPGQSEGSGSTAVARAMADARLAQSRWSRSTLEKRLKLVRQLRRLIAEHASQLAEASTSIRGRPAVESLTAEVLPLAEACRFLERNAAAILETRRLGRRGLPLWLAGVKSEIRREPCGVVLIIAPGNYPLLLPGVQLIQALVAGNAVLLKPGMGGTAAARALAELIHRAGFDSQLVTVLSESNESARAAILARPDKVLFTGSAVTGEKILAQLAPLLVPSTMELSGCDAVLVRADADLDLTVKALAFALRLNGGATCMAPKRLFVPQSLATELEGRLAQHFHSPVFSLTPGLSPVIVHPDRLSAVSTASLANGKAAEAAQSSCVKDTGLKRGDNERNARLQPLIEDALSRGAHFIAGDARSAAPVILGGVAPGSSLLREDIFAPVLSIVTVRDDSEALMRANDCPYALTASIFSRDESKARSLAASLNAGVVTINDLIIPTADARVPFGGRGRSGFGVTRGAEGLLALTVPKVITVRRGKFRPAFDAPQPGDEGLFKAYLNLSHGRGIKSRLAAMVELIRNLLHRSKSSPQENR